MAKSFQKFGLKKELNLSDLSNSDIALNTLLKRIDNGFTKEDLELIKDAYLEDITTGTFTSASEATVLLSRPGLPPVTYEPLITLQNRIDRAYFTTSEPFFFGGDGLTTRYFDSYQIERTGVGDGETPGNFYFDPRTPFVGYIQSKNPTTGRGTGGEIDKEIFWEEGDFNFGSKIRSLLLSAYGGVEWTGFFKPTETGVHSLDITTDGYVRIEFDSQTAPSKDFTFDPATETFKLDDLNFTDTGLTTLFDQTRAVDKGEISSFVDGFGTTDIAFAGENYGDLSAISTSGSGVGGTFNFRRDSFGKLFIRPITTGDGGRLYQVGDTLTFDAANFGTSEASNVVITVEETGGLEFYDEISGSSTTVDINGSNRTINVPLGNLEESIPYKIRITYFIDDDTYNIVDTNFGKVFNIEINRPSSSANDDQFDYKYLYNENYFDRYNLGDFKKFVDASINVGGTTLGDKLTLGLPNADGDPGEKYKNLTNLKPITSYYVAPIDVDVNSITEQRTGDISTTGSIVLDDVGSNPLDNLEIGNYVSGPGLYTGTRVISIGLTNRTLNVYPKPFSSSTGSTIEFIPHKGLVAYGETGGVYTDFSGTGERGFTFGNRSITSVEIVSGAVNSTPNANYGSFGGPDFIFSNSETGLNGIINISRDAFGKLQVSVLNGGTRYSNGDIFVVDGNDIENTFDDGTGPVTTNVVLKVSTLDGVYFTGEPSKVITSDQIFKEQTISGGMDWQYTDKIEDAVNGIQKTSVNSSIISRFVPEIPDATPNPSNSVSFKTPSTKFSTTPQSGRWYIYQSFGLNNDGLAGFCSGTFAKRILQKLTQTITGGTYAPYTTPVTITTTSGSGDGMTVKYRLNGTNNIVEAWVVDPGTGYVSGDTIDIPGSTPAARFTVGYTDLTGDVTLRLENSIGLQTGMYAHLFPAIKFITTTVTGSNGDSIDLLSSDVTITNIVNSINDPAGAAEVTLSAGGANVLNSLINFVSTVVTKVTFSETAESKEVCFRPTDTSPPFNATALGLATANDVKCVYEFTGSTAPGAQPGIFNPDSKLNYNELSLNTFEDKDSPSASDNVLTITGTDRIDGYIPIETPGGTFYFLLGTE